MKCFDNKRLYLDVIKNNPRDQYGISSQSKLQSLKLTVNCFCFVIKKIQTFILWTNLSHSQVGKEAWNLCIILRK